MLCIGIVVDESINMQDSPKLEGTQLFTNQSTMKYKQILLHVILRSQLPIWYWIHYSVDDRSWVRWDIKVYKKGVRYVVDVNTWSASTDCMVLKERLIYGLNVPCLACLYSCDDRVHWCRLSASGWLIEYCVWSHRLPALLGLLGSQRRWLSELRIVEK